MALSNLSLSWCVSPCLVVDYYREIQRQANAVLTQNEDIRAQASGALGNEPYTLLIYFEEKKEKKQTKNIVV